MNARSAGRLSALAFISLSVFGCSPAPVDYHQQMAERLPRTMAIVRTSTPENPKVLRILFYGQSITASHWIERSLAHLRRRYPNTRFVTANLAIGGFTAKALEHAAERDLIEAYPDLIVFHVYGDSQAYERIIRLARSRTAAEMILQTDHEAQLARRDHESWATYMSEQFIPGLADFYGLAVEPRRQGWQDYRLRHKLPRPALLVDEVHPNEHGWQLISRLFNGFFDKVVAHGAAVSAPSSAVSDKPVRTTSEPQRFDFTGNRIEIIATAPLGNLVDALVDGRRSVAIDGCWQTSRTNSLPAIPEWPAIRKIGIAPGLHAAEHWRATLTDIAPDQREFSFSVAGARTGPDGTGRSKLDFVSPSGRIRIATRDWMIPEAFALTGKRVPEGFRVSWTRRFACGDQPAVPLASGRQEVRYVVATDLTNGPHELVLRLKPEAFRLVRSLRIYRPPLRTNEMFTPPPPPPTNAGS